MAENSKIEWTDHTFNPWTGCTKISPGCDHCYAEGWAKRSGAVKWGAGEPRRRTTAANWQQPHKWNRQAQAEGRRYRVFCASLADVFDNTVDPQWRADLFTLISQTPNLDWLLLTKRIGNALRMIDEATEPWSWAPSEKLVLPNVWLGATVVNQEEADRDIPKLLATPAAVRFLSMEPLLAPVDLRQIAVPPEQDQLRRAWDMQGYTFNALQLHDEDRFHQPPAKLDWVIVGGESGSGARPMLAEWALDLRDQCAAAGVPFLFKQWGEWTPGVNVERVRGVIPIATFWDGRWLMSTMNLATDHGHRDDEPDLYRVGKKDAGRVLDGVTHDGFPSVADSRTEPTATNK